MMTRKIISLVIGLLFMQFVYSQNTVKMDWNTDLDSLAKQLPREHYNLFATHSKADFQTGIDAIKSQTDNLSDLQVALKIQQLVAKMGDSHTSLNYGKLIDPNKVLPLQLHWLRDGLYIIKTTPNNKEILGCQLVSINETPIATVIDSLATLFTVDNQAILKARIPQYIPLLQVLEYFGFTDNHPIKLGIKTQSDESKIYPLNVNVTDKNKIVSLQLDSIPFYLKNERKLFESSYQSCDKIYYIQYNKCWSRELEEEFGNKNNAMKLPSFNEFEKQVFQVLNEEKVDKIIFDMRFNGGGNSMQGTTFIEKLSIFLNSTPQIKTYVVLGRNTFSSAILNAMDFKRLTKAVLVGEETAGKPNHFGEVRNFQLPVSNLFVNYSTKYFKRTDEDLNTIKPDVLIETGFADFIKGIDPVYEWIKVQ